ncbi:MAG: hypothetical protein ACXU8U_06295 [Asticcacaulis sp.]
MKTVADASPAQSSDRQRLRARARLLLDAFEATTLPETCADILRAARTLMAIDRMLAQLDRNEARAQAASAPHQAPGIAAAAQTPPAPPSVPLNRHQRRAAAAGHGHRADQPARAATG